MENNRESLALTKLRAQNGSTTKCNGNRDGPKRKVKADSAVKVSRHCRQRSSSVIPASAGHFLTNFCNDAYGIQSQHADAVLWFCSSYYPLHKTKFGSQELRPWQFSSAMFLKSMGLKTRI